MFQPSLEEFKKKAKQGNLIPVYREILADMETPVSAFQKIDDHHHSFLLESMEGGEKWARYSFLGSRPSVVVRSFDRKVEIIRKGEVEVHPFDRDPLEVIKNILSAYKPVPDPVASTFLTAAQSGSWGTTWSVSLKTSRIGIRAVSIFPTFFSCSRIRS